MQARPSVHEPVKALTNTLAAEMGRRFYRVDFFNLLAEATLLDPRFKQRAFSDDKAADEATKGITAAAKTIVTNRDMDVTMTEDVTPSTSATGGAQWWQDFEERAAETLVVTNPTSDAINEVRGFLAEPLISKSADLLAWWKDRQRVYERLTAVMKSRLCIVATSVPSERIFSKTGQIISDWRNRISPAKVRELVFLNANMPLPSP